MEQEPVCIEYVDEVGVGYICEGMRLSQGLGLDLVNLQ